MESKVVEDMRKTVDLLLEEKIQIKTQIDKLNRLYSARDSTLNTVIDLYKEAKGMHELNEAKGQIDKSLENKRVYSNPDSKNTFTQPDTENPSKIHMKSNEKTIAAYKAKIKAFRRSMASLVKEIKHEMDVYKICFEADVEALHIKTSQTSPEIHSGRVVSEIIGSDELDEPPNDYTDEDFSRIQFKGIKKSKKSKNNS